MVLGNLLSATDWTRQSPKVPSRLSHPVIHLDIDFLPESTNPLLQAIFSGTTQHVFEETEEQSSGQNHKASLLMAYMYHNLNPYKI